MSRKFNPASLFEAWKPDPRLAPYPTLRSNLDAVQHGKKGMSSFGFPVGSMIAGDREYVALLREAYARNLVVVLHNRAIPGLPFERQEPHVFIARAEELWRIPAYLTLWDTAFVDGAWSNASEALHSTLLGYTKEQRSYWLARRRRDDAAYTCRTVYSLLTDRQRRAVVSVGKRCFGPAEATQGLALFFPVGDVQLKRNARRLLPRGVTLARAGLAWEASDALFGRPRRTRGVVAATVPPKLAQSTNAALRSNVEFLTRSGWG